MQIKRFLLGCANGLALLSMASSSFAQMSMPNGWYVEGNIGTTHVSQTNYSSGSSTSSPGAGGNINLGYKFMPYLGLELGYTKYSDVVIKDNFGNKVAYDKHYDVDLSFKGILPVVDSGFEAFAKVGIQRLNSSISINNQASATALGLGKTNHTSNGVYMGLGAQYYFMPEFAVVGQWARAKGSSQTGTLDLYSVGISFLLN